MRSATSQDRQRAEEPQPRPHSGGVGSGTEPYSSGHGNSRPDSRIGSLVRGLTGSLAAGLAVLALTLVVAQLWAIEHDKFGPGVGVVIGHILAALAAVTLQVLADRRRGRQGALRAAGVAMIVLAALTYWWWT